MQLRTEMRLRESAARRRQPASWQTSVDDRPALFIGSYSQVGLPQVTVWCPRECLSATANSGGGSLTNLLLFIQKSALREKERDLAARTMNTFGALRQMHF
jgi:hypothetical protein